MPDELKVPSGPCLEPEVLAAYVERTLPPDERARTEAHLAACGDCYALLTEVMRTTDDLDGRVESEPQEGGAPSVAESSKVLRPVFRRRRLWSVTGGVLAAAAALLMVTRVQPQWWQRIVGDNVSGPRLEKLVAVIGTDRTVEGRLSGGFRYGPVQSQVRSGQRTTENFSLLAAVGELQKRFDADPTPENVHAFGVGQMLLGRHDEAIRNLEDAVGSAPTIASFHSDLATAYIARASARPDALEDLARAIDAAERATALDQSMLEPKFNRALALERAGLKDAAIDAWNAYLGAETDSGWASEATAHLESLRRSGARRSECLELQATSRDGLVDATTQCPQEARELAESLLDEWAKAVLGGQYDVAGQRLWLAGRVGVSLSDHKTDTLLRDSIDWITWHPDRRSALAKGHEAFEAGRMLYSSDQRHLAIGKFYEARALLRQAGSPYWAWAQHYAATIHFHRRELSEALRLLAEIRTVAAARGYGVLEARAAWLTGVALLQTSDPARALDEYRRAIDLFDKLGERANVSNVSNAAADTQRILGDFESGWQSLSTALANVSHVGDPTRRYLAYYNAALYSHREGLEFAGLHFQNEALTAAKERRGPAGIVEASINKAAILGRLGRLDEAGDLLDQGLRTIASLDDPQQRAYMSARVAATRGELLIAHDPLSAVRELEAATSHFAKVEPAEAPKLWWMQGLAWTQQGDMASAAAAYATGIRSFDERLKRLRLDRQRISYSDEGWQLYRRLVELKLSEGDLDEALALADRSRSRVSTIGSTGVSRDRVRRYLRPGQIIVYYAVLERETHAWIFGSDSVAHQRIAVEESELERLASQVARLVGRRSRSSALEAMLGEMYAAIIAPLRLPEDALEIVLIPDGPLRMVPFGALRDPSHRFLVEKWAVVIAPSLAFFMNGNGDAKHGSREPAARALVVGDPDFDRARFSRLSPLPFAGQEAMSVARLYPGSTLLLRAGATKSSVLEVLPFAGIFHFAGHAVANDEFPERSKLLLTPGDGEPGELLADDLRTLRLKPGATVILSACQTGSGAMRRATGIQSLARAFLSVGASAVVAASWDVEDRDTAELMTTFHQHLSRGVRPAASLRLAQLKLISERRAISSWAAFALFGRQPLSQPL